MAFSDKRHVHLDLSGDTLQIATDKEVYHIAVGGQEEHGTETPPAAPTPDFGHPQTGSRPEPPPVDEDYYHRRAERPTRRPEPRREPTREPMIDEIEELDYYERAAQAREREKHPYSPDVDADELYELLPGRPTRRVPRHRPEAIRVSGRDAYHLLSNLVAQLSDAVQGLTADSDLGPTASTGERLDSIKGELDNIRKVNSRAARDVLQVGGRIRAGLGRSQRLIDVLASLRPQDADKTNAIRHQVGSLAAAHRTTSDLLAASLDNQARALEALEAVLRTVPVREQPKPKPRMTRFPMGDLFQVLHELAVDARTRKAVQVIWEGYDRFDPIQVDTELARRSPRFEHDEGLVVVPLDDLFQSLSLAALDEKYGRLVDKLNADRGSLFADRAAPVVMPLGEPRVPEQPRGSGLSPEDAARLAAVRDRLTIHLDEARAKTDQSLGFRPDMSLLASLKSSVLISGMSRAELSRTVDQVRELGDEMLPALEELADSLAFQDRAVEWTDRGVSAVADIHLQLIKTLISLRNTADRDYLDDQLEC